MKETIRSYIHEKILHGELGLSYETPLYSSGIMSSMAHIKLVNFLERKFRITIPAAEINLEEFDTVDQIVRFLNARKN